jgi:RNA polymerase sigma-70 factor (ECF subfamily)
MLSDDLQAIRRVLGGDPEAFRALVERYQRPLFCLVKNLLPDIAEREDVVQEVFLAAYRHLAAFDPGRSAFSTWLFTIARNKCYHALKKRRPLVLAEMPERADLQTPDREAAGNELCRRLDAALAGLPFEQQTAFVLAVVQGLSLEEVARIEGVKLGTVKSRLARAREKLRPYFETAAEPHG